MGAGDQRALATLYDASVRAIYSLAVRVVRDAHLAEEVTEDTFFHAWRDAARYNAQRGRVMTWLMVICRSRALDALRKLDTTVITDEIERFVADEISPYSDADALVNQFRINSAIRAAVEALPAQERQAISLSFFRGLTHQEIADQWQVPLGSVKTILNRAFVRLREACAPQWEHLNEH
jgi:RNA polymerase sigma-70 factor (ECF subfamily)